MTHLENAMQTIQDLTRKDTMYYGNIPVFIYQITYPSFTTTCSTSSAQKINDYYAQTAKRMEAYSRTVLYAQAVENARYIPSGKPPFNSYTFDSKYKVTYNEKCISSLYTETYTYMGGAHGETKRTSDTWDFHTGARLQLNDVYPLTRATLRTMQSALEQQAASGLEENPGSYFDDYKALLQKNFHRNSFYIQPGAVVIYYQQYDIAPYSTGLPEFYLPLHLT